MKKVVIVGCGNVGMAYAYALVCGNSSVDELVLIDINKKKAEGEALDLSHASCYSPNSIKVRAGDYSECDNANIVCICAGANQAIGETRTDLASKNIKIFKSIITEINKTKFNGIYLVATNPLDTMCYATMKFSKFPPNKVVGSGTTLDTARLKVMLSEEMGVDSKDIYAYVLGEHGDSEFVAWNNAMVGGNKCTEWLDKNKMQTISDLVKNSAYDVIEKKGNTCYGIGMCLLKITNAILSNDRSILTISCYNIEHDVYFSKPAIVGKNGVEKQLFINLEDNDKQKLLKSISALQETKKMID